MGETWVNAGSVGFPVDAFALGVILDGAVHLRRLRTRAAILDLRFLGRDCHLRVVGEDVSVTSKALVHDGHVLGGLCGSLRLSDWHRAAHVPRPESSQRLAC